MDLKIVNVPEDKWYSAISVANTYLKHYPDKPVGFHAGVVYYAGDLDKAYYVYKTKTQLVVRGA